MSAAVGHRADAVPSTAPAAAARSRFSGFAVASIAALYSCLVTFPLVLNLDRSIYGYPGDATGTVAVYSWWSFAVTHHLSIFQNPMWGAPYGGGWEAIPFPVLTVLVMAPLSAVVGGTVAYNLEVLSSFPLTAGVTYLVARRLGARTSGAAFAGLAFAFIPYHLEKAQGHVGQTHMEVYSAALLFLLRWRQGGSRWNLAAAGCFGGLALWIDYYVAFITACMVGTFFLISALHHRLGLATPAWLASHLVGGLIVAAVAALFVPLTVLAAERPSGGSIARAVQAQNAGFHRGLDELTIYSARRREYYLPYINNPLVPKGVKDYELAHRHESNFTEQSLLVGWAVTALAALAVVVRWRNFETWLLLGIGLAGFMIAEPPGMHRVGPLLLPTPSLLLNPLLPIFRVYARFGILVLLSGCLLGGLGFSYLSSRAVGWWRVVLAVPFLITAVEYNNIPPFHVTFLYPAPAYYQWLSSQPRGILLEYPLKAGSAPRQEIQNRQYVLYQHVHGDPIFNGGTSASQADQISDQLEPYYKPGVASRLREIGIRYVFVHRDDYAADGFDLPKTVAGLTFIESLAGVDIYRVDQAS